MITEECGAKCLARQPRSSVIVLIGAFWPGHYATGPNQSIEAMARSLAKDFAFQIVARDRPFGGRKALAETAVWVDHGWARFTHFHPALRRPLDLLDIMRSTPHDLIITNGFFDHEITLQVLAWRRLGLLPRKPMILSPRGEFSPGAIAIKRGRKAMVIGAVRLSGMLEGVWLHATGDGEAADIKRELPWHNRVLTAPNVRVLQPQPPAPRPIEGERLRLVFLSRIDRKKNLDYALSVLAALPFAVDFDIYGPVTDAGYWRECQELIAALPANVRVRSLGSLPHEQVTTTLAGYDVFFFPTRGENFGHAILDALEAGLPILISDQTPWRTLSEREAGWSLPLDNPAGFAAAIEQWREMAPQQRQRLRAGARRLAEEIVCSSDAVARSEAMLNTVMRANY